MGVTIPIIIIKSIIHPMKEGVFFYGETYQEKSKNGFKSGRADL